MKRIQFSELVNRQRRNLMGASFLMIGVVYFDIKIKDGALLGLTLDNFNTQTALTALLAFLIYHLVVFLINAWEEYQDWHLTFIETGSSLTISGSQVHGISDTLRKFALDPAGNSDETQSAEVEKAIVALNKFAKAFDQFPNIVRVRFWVFDIGLAVATSAAAIGFYLYFFGRMSCLA